MAVPARASSDAIETMARFLAQRLPVGSQLESPSGEVSPVGQLEGLVLRFPGITEVDFTVSGEVQHNRELDGILARITQALRPEPVLTSWRVMNADSEIAVYGSSAERMHHLIESRLGEELALHRADVRTTV